ncbi:hypothetical protein BKA58DRAFT_467540 [Alternaria rosae]|uniref:uncharacterized protein n=1 Tax=Alternaria rosae TaxID=1187941 RepID=UPI001E8DF289|nr:uncharacterized protein BKA58DRAFT_467540 [Alternaria rosae]KAH6875805.1 hypothetical protein BKA58DRAFT_467540 [Alternaria rosae]
MFDPVNTAPMQEVDRDCEFDEREPKPHYIPELSNAIERFLDAPYGSQLIIRFFAAILSEREADEYCPVYAPTPERYQDVCAAIPELLDPEALQYLSRQSTNWKSGEVLWDKGEGYTTVTRGSQAKVLPYHTRAALKEIKFRDIWDVLWFEAFALNMEKPIGDRMYQWMINMFARAMIQSKSQTVDMEALLRGLWTDERLRFWTWKEIPEAASSLSADGIREGEFGGIPRNIAQAQTIDTDSYESEDIHAFWSAKSDGPVAVSAGASSAENAKSVQTDNGQNTSDDSEDEDNLDTDTLRNCYGKAYLEEYGPFIQPLEHGKWDLDIPQDQFCVMCLETHRLLGVKMSACGHHFHFAYIKEWMNGSSPNSNLYPECRAQTCNERRKVQITGWMYDEEDDTENDEDDDEDEPGYSDDGGDEDEMSD